MILTARMKLPQMKVRVLELNIIVIIESLLHYFVYKLSLYKRMYSHNEYFLKRNLSICPA